MNKFMWRNTKQKYKGIQTRKEIAEDRTNTDSTKLHVFSRTGVFVAMTM